MSHYHAYNVGITNLDLAEQALAEHFKAEFIVRAIAGETVMARGYGQVRATIAAQMMLLREAWGGLADIAFVYDEKLNQYVVQADHMDMDNSSYRKAKLDFDRVLRSYSLAQVRHALTLQGIDIESVAYNEDGTIAVTVAAEQLEAHAEAQNG